MRRTLLLLFLLGLASIPSFAQVYNCYHCLGSFLCSADTYGGCTCDIYCVGGVCRCSICGYCIDNKCQRNCLAPTTQAQRSWWAPGVSTELVAEVRGVSPLLAQFVEITSDNLRHSGGAELVCPYTPGLVRGAFSIDHDKHLYAWTLDLKGEGNKCTTWIYRFTLTNAPEPGDEADTIQIDLQGEEVLWSVRHNDVEKGNGKIHITVMPAPVSARPADDSGRCAGQKQSKTSAEFAAPDLGDRLDPR